MNISHLLILSSLISVSLFSSEFIEKTLSYRLGNTTFEGIVTWSDARSDDRPAIIMIPNWMGPTENSLEKAQQIAGDEFVVFMVDMYGVSVRPTNMEEASTAATTVRADRVMMRQRVQEAIHQFKRSAVSPWDQQNLAAIGFCFGGGSVLEYGRSGASDLQGVVSFHGNLDTPQPASSKFAIPMLVLHGADDPFVPESQVADFHKEIANRQGDCTFVSFSGAVHSFTDPYANMTGKAEYHPLAAKRSMAMMRLYLQEWFTGERDVPVIENTTLTPVKGTFINIQPGEAKRPGSMGKR